MHKQMHIYIAESYRWKAAAFMSDLSQGERERAVSGEKQSPWTNGYVLDRKSTYT